jgi:hypothetical protein
MMQAYQICHQHLSFTNFKVVFVLFFCFPCIACKRIFYYSPVFKSLKYKKKTSFG